MSKLKPVLFYALSRRWGNYRVVAVTTEKARGRWWGRWVHDNEATHGAGDLKGRFDTQQAAQAKVEGYEAIQRRHADPIRKALDAYSAAQRDERLELEAYLK